MIDPEGEDSGNPLHPCEDVGKDTVEAGYFPWNAGYLLWNAPWNRERVPIPGDEQLDVRGCRVSSDAVSEFYQYSTPFPSPSVGFLPEGKARWITAEKQWYGFYHRWDSVILTSWGHMILPINSGSDG